MTKDQRRALYDRAVETWTDAELAEIIEERFRPSEIPPCCVCGGALSLQAMGRGPNVWGCVASGDDAHYLRSRYEDPRRGGDPEVIDLLRRFRGPATPGATKIEIEVSTENESTSFPWWVIVGQPMRRDVDSAAHAITGPFFSRAEATAELEGRRYRYGKKAVVWCLSGCDSGQYREAMKRAGRDGR